MLYCYYSGPGKGFWLFETRSHLMDASFPTYLVDLVMKCIESTSLRVLWNGSPSLNFTPSRAIRQGDPLSPYIFALCLERLSQLISKEVEAGSTWKPFKVSRRSPNISHLCISYWSSDELCITPFELILWCSEAENECGNLLINMSFAGRITLSKLSVLAAVLLYPTQSSILPESLCYEIEEGEMFIF